MTQDGKLPISDAAEPQLALRARQAVPRAAIGALLGLLLFASLAGFRIVAPSNINWLLDSPDPTTHYLGWSFFRHDQWRLPLGLNPNYGLASGSSIVYSDSIPLLAILFKPFASWLGEPFQYTGLWLMLCFMLQGLFAMLLGGCFVQRLLPQTLAAGLLLIPFIFLKRLDGHYALAGQWMVLWALYLYVSRAGDPTGRLTKAEGTSESTTHMPAGIALESHGPPATRFPAGAVTGSTVLACLAVLIHLYLAVLVLAIWSADLLRRWRADRSMLRRGSIEAAIVLLTLVLTMWLAGYFCLGFSDTRTPNSAGAYSMNLLSLIDSRGYSRFLPALPLNHSGQIEGAAYLGLGILAMIAVTLLVVWMRRADKNALSTRHQLPSTHWPPLLLVCSLLLLFAISPVITCGSAQLLALPNYWDGIGEVLRAAGRMSWPAVYVLPLLLITTLSKRLSGQFLTLVLAAVLLLQILDLTPMLNTTYQHFHTPQPPIRRLTDPFWASAELRYRQITLVPSDEPEIDWYPLAFYAADHGMAINHGYLARMNWDRKEAANRQTLADLQAGRYLPNAVYILSTDLSRSLVRQQDIRQIDGYSVFLPPGSK